ncbi:peptide-methionine (S)-S-oxide reductase MsrA [Croceiramulus getboli]|nr:peptide-methionine (S)-S-oxide reductase MsrA [Flavobacteriaceae bacterium YJPT1-3]
MKSLFISLLFLLGAASCQEAPQTQKETMALQAPVQQEPINGLQRAYFASGCFWCVEHIFESVKGVEEVISGYAGGTQKNPTYKEVSYGRTDHAEAVEIYYDPKVISFETLVKVFFGSHNPTTLNRQGPDRGPQYRSIAFYQNEEEKKIIEAAIERLNTSTYDGQIVTEVQPFQKFWEAEDYHQDYKKNNPNNSYIRNVSVPRYKRFAREYPELLKEDAH